jgi:K+-sensing histidine kinase KdpD
VILRQASRLSEMVEDLLDVGRVRNGKITVQRKLLDLADVVANAVATLTESGKLVHHRLELHADPVFVEADPVRIEQVVVNLLSNAIKYTPEGGAIDVRTTVDRGDAVLRVRDTGIGIPQDLLPQIVRAVRAGGSPATRAHERARHWSGARAVARRTARGEGRRLERGCRPRQHLRSAAAECAVAVQSRLAEPRP